MSLVTVDPDAITLTAGGNDLLQGFFRIAADPSQARTVVDPLLGNLQLILERLKQYSATVVLNTVYDPTDGDDTRSSAMGLPPEARTAYDLLNEGIRKLGASKGVILCDLEKLFHGQGYWSADPWIVSFIEPNLAGATATAHEWHRLLMQERQV